MSIVELEAELETSEARRRELSDERAAARRELEQAREHLADGTVVADTVSQAEARINALSSGVWVLDERISSKQLELSRDKATEARAAQVDELARIAAAAQNHLKEYEQAKAELAAVVEAAATRLTASLRNLSRCRNEFLEQAAPMVRKLHGSPYGLTPEDQSSVSTLLTDLSGRGANLAAVRIQWIHTVPSVLDSDSGPGLGAGEYGNGDNELQKHPYWQAILTAFTVARQKARQPVTTLPAPAPTDEQMVKW